MKTVLRTCLFFFTFLSLCYASAEACTNVTVTASDGTVIVGRTLEFGPDLNSNIILSPRDKKFETKAPDGQAGLNWSAKYGYLLLDYFNQNHAVDGMNEKGLSFGYLYLPGYTKYPTVAANEDKQALPYDYLGDWILSNFDNVADVKNALNNVKIFAQPATINGQQNVVFPLHAIVTDASGNSIVIEFVDGQQQVHDNPLGVLTNSPTFSWHMNNLKNYDNLTPYAKKPLNINGFEYTANGQGSGLFGLPGDATPPSRFVKMSFLKQTALPVEHAHQALILAQHILNSVDIPKGMVRGVKGEDGPVDSTQWTVFKDLKNHILYFRSYDNTTLQSIKMDELDFSANAKALSMPVVSKPIISNATQQFKQAN